MKKSNIFGTSNRRSINPKWFTGKVWMKELSSKIGSKEQDIYHVHFPNGSRTKLHSHNGAQLLIATSGNGSLITFSKQGTQRSEFSIKKTKTIKLNVGDIVYVPPKTLHTHGSISDEEFSHIAINVLPQNSEYKTEWFESDEKSKYRRI